MLDLSYFQNQNSNVQGFFNGGTWQTWVKPRNAKMVSFFVQGAGGGGGGGFQAATGNKSGGSGGGSGGTVKLIVKASLLPDILHVLPGIGGTGGTGGAAGVATAGSAATKSYVCLIPDTSNISNIVCTSGAIAAQGGASGTTVTPSQGVAETVAGTANMIFANLGTFLATAGVVGGTGGLTSGANTSIGSFIVGASGGGGTAQGGSAPNGAGIPVPVQTGGAINSDGKAGLIFYKPMLALTGGSGAGGATTGGRGGNGAPGCGGGGGGAGTVSAGNGGKGGDGFIIITTSF